MVEKITTSGLRRVAQLIAADFTKMTFGTGTTPATKDDTKLENPVLTIECDSIEVSGKEITYTASIHPGTLNNVGITEIGIVNANGVLLRRDYIPEPIVCSASRGAVFSIPIDLGGDF